MLDLNDKLFLAPLAGYSDRVFRSLSRRCGADVTVTEMVSVKGVIYGQEKTLELMESDPGDRPYGIQLFGSEPELFAEAGRIVCGRFAPDFIDVNCGCPVRKVLRQNAGARLLREPRLIGAIVAALKKSVNVPVSIKIRLGYSEEERNYLEVCRAAVENGVDFIAVHGRTAPAFFSGPVDFEAIAGIKKALAVPVVANGGVTDFAAWSRMRETGCDSVMIGQAAMAQPWIFSEIRSARSGCFRPTSMAEKIGFFRENVTAMTQKMGTDAGLRLSRSLAMQYIRKIFRGLAVKKDLMRGYFELASSGDLDRFFAGLERIAAGLPGT